MKGIHPVFHVSQLKRHVGPVPTPIQLGVDQPEAIVGHKRTRGATLWLYVKWKNRPIAKSTFVKQPEWGAHKYNSSMEYAYSAKHKLY